MAKVIIAPSILSCDFSKVGAEVKDVEQAGAEWLHIDVMDGHFVPNLTIGPTVVKSVRRVTNLFLDVHLMIEEPVKYAAPFAEAGADLINFHIEATGSPEETIAEIRRFGKQVGITIKPKTPVDAIRGVLESVDMVLVMSVEPGFAGQKFMPEVLEKVTELRKLMGPDRQIQIDGGISPETVGDAAAAGANVFVAGSAVFGKKDRGAVVASLRELADEKAQAWMKR
jgi:ribulose-phosphate 3-epimerase